MLPLALLTFFSPVLALATVTPIYTFPNSTWAENITPRPNGDLLITSTTTPSVFSIDPSTGAESELVMFPYNTSYGTLGITPIHPGSDTYAVVVSSIGGGMTIVPNTTHIWCLDLSGASVSTREIGFVPGAILINGLTSYGGQLYGGDSLLGAIWQISLDGSSTPFIVDPLLGPGTASPTALGINGLKSAETSLYLTNSARGIFGRYALSNGCAETDSYGRPVFELLAQLPANASFGFDDFSLDPTGTAYIATHPATITVVHTNGTVGSLNATVTDLPTSTVWVNGTLYFTTAGLQANGSVFGGGVYKVDL